MGHSEMLLAVAGLSAEEIQERTRKLGDGDWSDFPPAEAQAFGFAYRLTKDPLALSDREVEGLIESFGRTGALDLVWYASWCNYMTRVADAFQFNLEVENVFAETPAASTTEGAEDDPPPDEDTR